LNQNLECLNKRWRLSHSEHNIDVFFRRSFFL